MELQNYTKIFQQEGVYFNMRDLHFLLYGHKMIDKYIFKTLNFQMLLLHI